jgi:CheY-like chemotaxis protein
MAPGASLSYPALQKHAFVRLGKVRGAVVDTKTQISSPREVAPRRSLRVLVADDDRDEVLTLVALLREEGHETHAAYGGRDVMRMVREFAPDVVLLDIGMPDRNGYDLARQITLRYADRRPRLIAVTAWTKPSDRMLSEMAGFDHHVPKPYDPRELLSLIRPLRDD